MSCRTKREGGSRRRLPYGNFFASSSPPLLAEDGRCRPSRFRAAPGLRSTPSRVAGGRLAKRAGSILVPACLALSLLHPSACAEAPVRDRGGATAAAERTPRSATRIWSRSGSRVKARRIRGAGHDFVEAVRRPPPASSRRGERRGARAQSHSLPPMKDLGPKAAAKMSRPAQRPLVTVLVADMRGFCALVDRDRFRPRGGQFKRIGLAGLLIAPPNRRPALGSTPGGQETAGARPAARSLPRRLRRQRPDSPPRGDITP